MQTTWEKAVQHIEISLGQGISTEFQTRTLVVIIEPTQSQEILNIHSPKFQLWNTTHSNLREARNKVLESLEADDAINNLDDVLNTVYTQNEI